MKNLLRACLKTVASAILADVEPGFQPDGNSVESTKGPVISERFRNAGDFSGRQDAALCGRPGGPPLLFKPALGLCFISGAVALFIAGCSTSGRIDGKPGWTVLFDGKSTEAFRGFKQDSFPTNSWVIDDATLKSLPAKQIDLITRERYESFELELEWKVAREANSGIMFHVSEDEPETYRTGPEMQIVDDANTSDGKNPKTSAGSLYALIAPTNKKCRPAGEWNHIRLVVQGNHVEHWMNGAKILEYELGSETLKALIANSKFKAWPRFAQEKSGYIALQNHGGSVWFRKIRVRRL